jgi:HTH-type transcriptional regulator/antitoxin HigA
MATKKNNIIPIPPGETIKEMLEDRDMSQVEFAERMGCSTKFISQLINGKVALTHPTALKLESVLSVPARFWNNLEALYQEDLARIDQVNELESEISIAKSFPYTELAKKHWIKKTRNDIERVEELRSYYEVATLGSVKTLNTFAAVFRKVDHGKASEYALSAWIQKGYIEGRKISTPAYNKRKLTAILLQLRSLVSLDPTEFYPRLISLLKDCGVVLIFLPHLKNTFAHAATIWPSKTKPIIILSIRGKDADKFWFSFFHEIGHLMLHEKDNTFIQYDDVDLKDGHEAEADQFASNLLVPEAEYKDFIALKDFSEKSIIAFAAKIEIPAGIVVGRLQHDQKIGFYDLNHLKVKYEWDNHEDF